MSLVGFKATNHPQQTGKRGAKDATDDRGTDRQFFDVLSRRFGGFTLDVAASAENAKCEEYYTLETNGLSGNWGTKSAPQRVWCNPPYSDLRTWLAKAWAEWSADNCESIVMLVPANRTEQGWWQDFVEPFRDQFEGGGEGGRFTVEFLRGRMRFDRPGAVIGPKGDRPPFGCCLLIWEHR